MRKKSKGSENKKRETLRVEGAIVHLVNASGKRLSLTWRPLPAKLTDEEAGRVVLPGWPVSETFKINGKHLQQRSDGTGRLWQPESDFGWPSVDECREAYLDAMPAGHVPSKGSVDASEGDNGKVERVS